MYYFFVFSSSLRTNQKNETKVFLVVKDWRKSEIEHDRQTFFRRKSIGSHQKHITGNVFYTLTLTYREAEVPWPTLSTEETLKVSFTQAPVAAAIIFTDVCSCCQRITSAP